jgi:uncharacterized protein (TIRG00374 family)
VAHTVPRSETAATVAPEASRRPRGRVRKALSVVVSVGILVAVFWYFLPQFTSVSSVWKAIAALTPAQIALLCGVAAWNLVTYDFVQMSTAPGLTFRQAFVVTESATAVSNTMPAGGAIGIAMTYQMFGSWGFSRSRATVALLVSGIWNNFAKLALPILALALVALQGKPSGGRIVAGLLGILALVGAVAVFATMLHSDETARRFGLLLQRWVGALLRVFRRPAVTGWDIAVVKFRRRTILLLRARWHAITLATVVSHLSLFLVLLVSLRAMGVSSAAVSWIDALAVFSFARLVTAIPFTPGGVGLVELALIAGLAAAGGARADVAAAVLVFRALTYVVPIPLGAATYVFWRRNKTWRRPPGTAPRTPLVPETVDADIPAREPVVVDESPTEAHSENPRARRHPSRDAVLLAAGVAVLVATSLAVHARQVSPAERAAFRLFNNPVTVPFVIVWSVMQVGNVLAIPVAAAVSAAARRFRLAAGILVGGAATYELAKVVKGLVVRGRPAALLAHVHIHGAAALGRGYVSGHAAVVGVLAVLLLPVLRGRWRWVVVAVAVAVCVARMYVGAHLPLDIVGGAALGVAVGAVVRLVAGRRLA